MGTLREFITQWGFKIDASALRKFRREQKTTVTAVKRNFKSMGEQAAKTGRMIKAALAGAAVAFAVRGLVNITNAVEQNEIAFRTMLGSAEKARQMMARLSDFARRTPFDLPQVRQNAKLLLGMGIEATKIVPTMKALGDVAAGLSVPLQRLALNFGQVRARGKLTGQELRDFAVAGVPIIAQLAKQLGVSESAIAGMVSKGKIGFKEVEKAFISMTSAGGRFNNLMIEQSKSIGGLLSNLKDFAIIIVEDIGKKSLSDMKFFVKDVMKFIDENRDTIVEFGSAAFSALIDVASTLFTIFKFGFGIFKDLVDAMGGAKVVFDSLINVFLTLTGIKFFQMFARLFKLLKVGKKTVIGIGAGFGIMLTKIKPVIKALGKVALILLTIVELPALLIDDFAAFLEGADSVLGRAADKLASVFKAKFTIPALLGPDMMPGASLQQRGTAIVEGAKSLFGSAKEFFGFSNDTAVAAGDVSNANSSSVVIQNDVKINANNLSEAGAKDAIAKSFREQDESMREIVGRQMRRTQER